MTDDLPTKLCKWCGEVKFYTGFWYSETRGAYNNKCKLCLKNYQKNYKQLLSTRYGKLVRGAALNNKTLDITKEQYIQFMTDNSKCYYCEDLFPSNGKDGGYQLDRIDNSKGYQLDNVVRCCNYCNCLRLNHYSCEEFKFIVNYLLVSRGFK